MSLPKRPAYWIGSITSLVMVFGSLALMVLNVLPEGSVAIAARIACVLMFSTLVYLAYTDPSRKNENKKTGPSKDTL